ncbi:MAG: glycosyltransferase family 4 protein [Alkalinema sp. RU_4_3]|nr:glycosyltransferase family 4 protein [Alkalinema sp. RU_4_3]
MGLRVLIVAEHASAAFGGEAALPLHYYRVLRDRGTPVWLVVHMRTRAELDAMFPGDPNIIYIEDSIWNPMLWRMTCMLPGRLAYFTTGFMMRLLTQMAQRRKVRQLVQQEQINVIHQPMPVSPKEPSMLYDLGAPVVIGPMNGGMNYPPAFRKMQSPLVDKTLALGRKASGLMNTLMPGKKKAALLLVANQRTRQALPQGVCQNVVEMVENGVDLSVWESADRVAKPDSAVTRYAFMGRLVHWKAVDLLLEAFTTAAAQAPITLTIIGDGEDRAALQQQAEALGILSDQPEQAGKIWFAGWRSQPDCSALLEQADALVLPSLLECGGSVVLEAMTAGLPAIATNWGGPTDYLNDDCGILVEPTCHEGFIEGLSAAMVKLAQSPELRISMGQAAQQRAREHFDWEAKVDRMTVLYQQAIATHILASQERGKRDRLDRTGWLNGLAIEQLKENAL